MKSIILCEGPDDLWFLAYYLNKTADWDNCNQSQIRRFWPNYTLSVSNKKQQVLYMFHENDSAAIWCVAGKDSFDAAIQTILNKFVDNYPSDPINSLVLLRDRDMDRDEAILSRFESSFENKISLQNKASTIYSRLVDGENVRIRVTPVIIPFDDCGAIESLLMASVRDHSREGQIVVDEACRYIDCLNGNPEIGQAYLRHEREIVKAKFAATIAATNPGHATGLFQDLVLSCPWERSEYVKKHFDVALKAISTAVTVNA